MSDLTINFVADFNSPSGEGRHTRCFGAALARHARVLPLPLRRPEPIVHDDAPPLRPARWDNVGVGICLATWAAQGCLAPCRSSRRFGGDHPFATSLRATS
jgi:hypothetical protein